MKRNLSPLLALFFLFCTPFIFAQTWIPVGDSLNGPALCLEEINGKLYVGGAFSEAGTNFAHGILSWDGNGFGDFNTRSWPPGPGAQIHGFANYQGTLLAFGSFSFGPGQPEYIAEFNGTQLTGSTYSINATIFTGFADGDSLYLGGFFTTQVGSPHDKVMIWNGQGGYQPIGNGLGVAGAVTDMVKHKGVLYASGNFARTTPTNVDDFAYFDGSDWVSVAGPASGVCQALASGDSFLYVGGNFAQIGVNNIGRIAAWDGTSLRSLGSGIGGGLGGVTALLYHNGILYAGGDFTTAGGNTVSNIAQWDGTTWSQVGNGLPARVNDLAIYNGDLYAVADTAGAGYGRLWKFGLATGQEDPVAQPRLEVFPNPMGSVLHVRMDGNNGQVVRLRDLQGRILREGLLEGAELIFEVEELERGIYFVEAGGSVVKVLR